MASGKPTTPHGEMTLNDMKGISYVVRIEKGGHAFDVLQHSDDWLLLRPSDCSEDAFWLRIPDRIAIDLF